MHSRSRSRFTKRFGDVGLDRAKDSEWRRIPLSGRRMSKANERANVREKTVVPAVLDGYRGLKGADM